MCASFYYMTSLNSNSRSIMAFHLLHWASKGNVKKIEKLVDYGVHINASNIKNETALFISSMNGHAKCVEYLLNKGADPNLSSSIGMTPLHVAIQQDHVKCVALLLQYGSDLHNTFAEYPTVVAFARYHGNHEILRLLHSFMVDRGFGHHQPAQNYNSIVMNSCASASCVRLTNENIDNSFWGIPLIELDDIKKPEHKHSFKGPFFNFIDGMWRGSLVTVKHAPKFNQDSFYHYRLRKEINLLRQLRHFRFPVAMAICLNPFCLIMERFYFSTLFFYVRQSNMDMEKDLECHLMRIIRIMMDIAQALSHLHRRNWIHCHVTSHSIFVCDGPRAKLGSLEFCERSGASVKFMECFQDELPWLAPELLAVGKASFPDDIYSFAATLWECLTRTTPWSWCSEDQIPYSRLLPILLCWPSLIKHLVSQCLDEMHKRPTADILCRKLGEFMRLGIWLDRHQLDDMFQRWLIEHRRCTKNLLRTPRSLDSSKRDLMLVDDTKRRRSSLPVPKKPHSRRRSAVVATLVEEALSTVAHVARQTADVKEADIFKFGFKLAREIAELRAFCAVAIKKKRKAWAKVAMATRDLEEDMFDSLVGYEEVTFRRKHAHAANLKKHHQEKEEEKLKESLHYKRSLIERHHRKNWACYTMLLCEIYGILRRRCTINDDEDYENETLTQSVARISNQLSNFSNNLMESSENDIVSKSINSLDFEECRSNDKHSWENDDDGGGGDDIYNNQSLCLDIRSNNCVDLSNMDRDKSDIDGDKRYEHGKMLREEL
ncbi:uncharacterized protein LOC124453329 isoform X2 [Xenia sp. Carnegie-2017]|uniref:uncharacterized protein LOC124453329 isoform X2 n=1 Tax=Xenia sp. Carnegie-2017 TaxID=2897299 RepID=UPI001F03E9E1|nr:uncharacterized protein LOC124453329 isoform X2 [Xenia sp. Carnegie-2017]